MYLTAQNRRPSVIRSQIPKVGQPVAQNVGGIKIGAESLSSFESSQPVMDSGDVSKLGKAQSTSGVSMSPTSVVKVPHKMPNDRAMNGVAESGSPFCGSQPPRPNVDNLSKIKSTSGVSTSPTSVVKVTHKMPNDRAMNGVAESVSPFGGSQPHRPNMDSGDVDNLSKTKSTFEVDKAPTHTDLESTSPTPGEKDRKKIQEDRYKLIRNFMSDLHKHELQFAFQILEDRLVHLSKKSSKNKVSFKVHDMNSEDPPSQTTASGSGTDKKCEGKHSDKEKRISTKLKKSDIFSVKSNLSEKNTYGGKDSFKDPNDHVNSIEIQTATVPSETDLECEDKITDEVNTEMDSISVMTDPSTTKPQIKTMSISNSSSNTSEKLDTLQFNSNLKSFKCEHCGQEFKNKSQLKNHTKIHYGNIEFPCNGCSQVFLKKSSLALHMKKCKSDAVNIIETHTCDICSKKFGQKSALTIHQRTHSGEKPYGCKKCGKLFSHSNSKNRHELTCQVSQETMKELVDGFLTVEYSQQEDDAPATQSSPPQPLMSNVDSHIGLTVPAPQRQGSSVPPPSGSSEPPPPGLNVPPPPGSNVPAPSGSTTALNLPQRWMSQPSNLNHQQTQMQLQMFQQYQQYQQYQQWNGGPDQQSDGWGYGGWGGHNY